MSRIQPTYSDRVRYILQHDETGFLKVQEPIGWRDDDNEFVRHKTYHGINVQLTNKLEFVDNGANYISEVFLTYGIKARIRLVKDERNPRTDVWTRSYDGFLDLSTYERKDNIVSIKFNSSNLLTVLKSRESEKFEITRTETINGTLLDPLKTDIIALNGRRIFLKSLLETDPEQSVSTFQIESDTGNWRWGTLGINTTVTYQSDIRTQAVFPNSGEEIGGGVADRARVEQLFYADNDRDKTLDIKINASFNLEITELSDTNASNEFLQVVIAEYTNSTDYDIVDRQVLQTFSGLSEGKVFQVNIDWEDKSYYLKKGNSLSFQVYWGAELGDGFFTTGQYRVSLSDIQNTIKIDEDSFWEASQCEFVLPHEFFDRLSTVITNRNNAFYSEVLGRVDLGYSENGDSAYLGITNGFWIRGFNENTNVIGEDGEEVNLYKPPSTSVKEALTSYFATRNLGLGIEKIGFQERFRIEPLEFFYNRNVLIHLGKEINGKFEYLQVNNVTRSVASEYYYQGLDFGYEKFEQYEEAVGLDEYNIKSTFFTTIDVLDNKYKRGLSKYRADSYGIEFARRKPENLFPTEDTNYDKHVFFLDAKEGITDVYEQRVWQDDFEKQPTGVFSPDTAHNLRLSPVNMLLKHERFISSGLTKYPNDYIRYASSEGNSELKTQQNGREEFAENGDILNSQLSSPRYIPEYIEFEYEVDFDLLQQVKGTTIVLGKEIQNVYGLVQFKNEKNQNEKGYLINLKPNGVGKWKLLKFNKVQEESTDTPIYISDENNFVISTSDDELLIL